MSDEKKEVKEEVVLSEEQEIEEAMALMPKESDDADESVDDAGDSGGDADKPDGDDAADDDSGDDGADGKSEDQPAEEADEKKSAKEERVGARLAQLMKKENEFRKEKAKHKEDMARVDKVAAILDNIKEDPYGTAEQLFGAGFYKNWTMKKLGKKEENEEPETPKEKALRERIEQLEGAEKEKTEKQEQAAEDAGIKAYEADVKKTIEAAGDEFELMGIYPGAVTEARAWAELYAEEFEQVPHPKDAIGAMEKYFREQLKTGLNTKYGRLLIAELSAADSDDEESDDSKEETKTKGKTKTVKNRMAASSGGVKPSKADSIDEQDMIDDGIAEFNRQMALAEKNQ